MQEIRVMSFSLILKKKIPFLILFFLIFLQIIVGAFVSGLDAGKIYQTWPLMGNAFFPDDINMNNLENLIEFNNHSLVQFYHRNLAYFIFLYFLCLSIYIYKMRIKKLYKPLNLVTLFMFTQIVLGILTLISGLNIYLASAHQFSSVLLILSALNLYYFQTK